MAPALPGSPPAGHRARSLGSRGVWSLSAGSSPDLTSPRLGFEGLKWSSGVRGLLALSPVPAPSAPTAISHQPQEAAHPASPLGRGLYFSEAPARTSFLSSGGLALSSPVAPKPPRGHERTSQRFVKASKSPSPPENRAGGGPAHRGCRTGLGPDPSHTPSASPLWRERAWLMKPSEFSLGLHLPAQGHHGRLSPGSVHTSQPWASGKWSLFSNSRAGFSALLPEKQACCSFLCGCAHITPLHGPRVT